ncbi:ATG8-interacting protein 2-like [Andrographis paniculata]|uniref:ATG8-interacting protein 2-like n=1 Tax=Andrographis paniculata TaxID=175694 RepID=UPI0021E8F4A7|nr:ATG8-interacting protein 2-like [Andrographis paniculata]XP_051127134.1 ATG8-interacting protein 2-like [Andrographis paniculata]
MSDNKEDETVPKGNEWEVVALTESAYAAAPGPKQNIFDAIGDNSAETADALFMSGHFKYSPSIHENMLVEAGSKEKPSGMGSDSIPEAIAYEGSKSESKSVDDIHLEGLISEEFPEAPKFKEKGGSGSFYSSDFEDVASSNLMVKEQAMYRAEKFSSYDDEATAGRSYATDEDIGVAEPFEPLDHAIDPCLSNVPKHNEDDKFDELPGFSCEGWWKRHASSLYDHVKNVNPYWSIVVAAAVVGLVIIGHRWQRDKPPVLKLKSQLVIDDKGSHWILGPVARLKDVSLGNQNGSYLRASTSTGL